MNGLLVSAGERLWVESSLDWVGDLIAEGAAGELAAGESTEATVCVHVDADRRPFETGGWDRLARGAWRKGGEVVVENICTAGFDLHLRCAGDRAEFTYRWRPPPRDRAAARVLRSRFHLLARASLLQYPVLWWAGTHGRAPLHASGTISLGSTALLTAQSGIGRSTLVMDELGVGGRSTGDNLAVGDGTRLWGLVEPVRVKGGSGRRMPHGRHETSLPNRLASVDPDCVVVVVRGRGDVPSLSRCSADESARALVTSTYMAGELRRYWGFAAALALGTGIGPAHPPVTGVATAFAERLPCFSFALGRTRGPCVFELLDVLKVAA